MNKRQKKKQLKKRIRALVIQVREMQKDINKFIESQSSYFKSGGDDD